MSMPWLEMSAEEFEMHVTSALDQIPDELAAMIDNCVILVEDYPPADIPDTLGLYSGTPLTERGEIYTGLPDQILIFRQPILAMCNRRERWSRRSGSPWCMRSRTISASTTSGCTSSVTAEQTRRSRHRAVHPSR